jgi:uncharacterized membrane protein YgcG
LALCMASSALAQRHLSWDLLQVYAHLAADGKLEITEAQTMVLSGDWNGGERKFNIRPRQTLSFIGMSRIDAAARHELTEGPQLYSVDDYAWTNATTLRWRSRQPSDPPFANTKIRYELRYELSGILLKDGDGYLLDHDFAFPDRDGTIDRFVLHLTLDPVWQPVKELEKVYMTSGIPPGRSYVLKIPLRYVGAGVPLTLDASRPPEIVMAVSVLLGVTGVALLWFFAREQLNGRFARVTTGQIDEAWLREHILKYPAEVVGAAWDETVGLSEVVALIARMVSEGKLTSSVSDKDGSRSAMSLHLQVDRSTLQGHERTLVDGLFFNGRTETSTEAVKAHYKEKGFNPSDSIKKELEEAVKAAIPAGRSPLRFRVVNLAVFVVGFATFFLGWYRGEIEPVVPAVSSFAMLVVLVIALIAGTAFRARIDWGRVAALLTLIPSLIVVAAVAIFLWFWVGVGAVDIPQTLLVGVVALTLGVTNFSINSLKSRQKRAAIAFRKQLAAARDFFMSELGKAEPALRDAWYPWVLAFGLARQTDQWSARHGRDDSNSDVRTHDYSTHSSGSASSGEGSWTGFGGGRSGGGGGGASWAAAATGMAAGVSPPSSSGSGGSSSSSGGSSSSSSSGGGGGGGW